jgi:flagellar biogenesis protein FliO
MQIFAAIASASILLTLAILLMICYLFTLFWVWSVRRFERQKPQIPHAPRKFKAR